MISKALLALAASSHKPDLNRDGISRVLSIQEARLLLCFRGWSVRFKICVTAQLEMDMARELGC